MKPIIFQDRRKAEFVSLNKPDDPNVFMDRRYLFGVDARHVAGFGFHQLAYGSKATLDAAAFAAARSRWKHSAGRMVRRCRCRPAHLVCGPSRRRAGAVLMKEYLASGESNTNYKAVNLIVNPWLG